MNEKDQLTTMGFQANHNIHWRALWYNPNTIVIYPKTPNATVYVGCHEHLYKSYCNIAAGLLLHYNIPKAAAMWLSK